MLSRMKECCKNVLNRGYESTYDFLTRVVQSKKIRFFGFIVGGVTAAESVNYCINLLGSTTWLAGVNYSATALSFLIAGTLGYIGFDLSIKGLSDLRKNCRQNFEQMYKYLRIAIKNQTALEKSQDKTRTSAIELFKDREKTDKMFLNIIKKLAVSAPSSSSSSSNPNEIPDALLELELAMKYFQTSLAQFETIKGPHAAQPFPPSPVVKGLSGRSRENSETELKEIKLSNSPAPPLERALSDNSLSRSPNTLFAKSSSVFDHPLMTAYALDEAEQPTPEVLMSSTVQPTTSAPAF